MSTKSFNKEELLSNFEGDEDILIDLINEFESKSQNLILDIKEAVDAKDSERFKIAAHTFKGVVSNFYAEEMRLLAFDLEKMGMEKKFDGAFEKIDLLNILLSDLLEELTKLKQTLN